MVFLAVFTGKAFSFRDKGVFKKCKKCLKMTPQKLIYIIGLPPINQRQIYYGVCSVKET